MGCVNLSCCSKAHSDVFSVYRFAINDLSSTRVRESESGQRPELRFAEFLYAEADAFRQGRPFVLPCCYINIIFLLDILKLFHNCLKFLATGDSFQTIAFSYRLGHSTVHAIVQVVCNAIVTKLLTIPTSHRKDWENIFGWFWTTWNFPNCLGALDGKHIEIVAPKSGLVPWQYEKNRNDITYK
ncbi:hypothetical protein NQ318_022821 [Aromia moschata]|uniref:DDE Tnp4 domain-containing protein n=1 Tax=Aromia moschata TaxID=1265417 RepID=A0AAV8XJG8_9CUCU|nr:hypothetical protein NQ318_022821 [Aromia moschata]